MSKIQVLLAEDTESFGLLICKYLKNFQIIWKLNGSEAYNYFLENQLLLCCVITDYQMPTKGGIIETNLIS